MPSFPFSGRDIGQLAQLALETGEQEIANVLFALAGAMLASEIGDRTDLEKLSRMTNQFCAFQSNEMDAKSRVN